MRGELRWDPCSFREIIPTSFGVWRIEKGLVFKSLDADSQSFGVGGGT
jgi:hypothetical protein